jgi:hypothetical protein
MNTWKILDPKSLETNVDEVGDDLAAGQVAFGDIAKYDLERMNNPSTSKIAGDAKVTPFPTFAKGQHGGSLRWVRMYSIPKKSRYKNEAWTLLQYESGKDKEGKYYVPKHWYLLRALGFAYPQLADDPEIVASTKNWGDPTILKQQGALGKSKENLKAPWFAEWDTFHRGQLQEALLKKTPPKAALLASAQKAAQLKKEWS